MGLTFSSIVVATGAVSFVVEAFTQNEYTYSQRDLLMNADGEFQQVKIERSNWDWNNAQYSVRPAEESANDFSSVDDQWELAEYSVISPARGDRFSWFDQFESMGDFGSGSANRGHVSLFIHRGRLLAYERGHLTAIITPQGVSRDGEIANDQFEKLGLFSSLNWGQIAGQIGTNPLMVDASGLYQFDSNTFALNQLLPKTPDKVCLLYADDRSPATIWTVNGETLTQHLVSTIEDGIELTEEALTENHTVGIPLIKIDSSKEHKIDSLDMEHSISVFRGDDGRYGYVQYNIKTNEHFYGMLEEDGGVAKVGPVVVPPFINPQITSWALGIPPLFGYVGVIENLFFDQRGIFSPWEILGFTISQALLAAVGTLLLCKWRAYY